jgi:hypothetical protein
MSVTEAISWKWFFHINGPTGDDRADIRHAQLLQFFTPTEDRLPLESYMLRFSDPQTPDAEDPMMHSVMKLAGY